MKRKKEGNYQVFDTRVSEVYYKIAQQNYMYNKKYKCCIKMELSE